MYRIWIISLAVLFFSATAAAEETKVDFNRDIRPILSDKCFHCHGPDANHREAELRLDDESSAKLDRDGYRVIDSETPAASELLARITSTDGDIRMPPADSGKSLTRDEIQLLERWIQEGAAWSRHWAYVTPVRAEPPAVKDRNWPRHWIDNFILARLESEGLAPADPADEVTLVRRLHFDLTGLPPTPETVKQFINSTDPRKYEQLVDELLDDDAFGERLAIYWLDLVRFADTVGYHGDQDQNISPYRDYVLDAFNDNLPFDQFTIEQLAGDLLPDPTVDQRIATGYNRLLQTSHEGGVQPKEYLAIYAADRIRNLSAVWMGATMGCCQCHDHKDDPYSTKDFYSLSAFFADIDEAKHFKVGSNSLPTARPPEIQVHSKRERQRLAELEQRIASLTNKIAAAPSDDLAAELAAIKSEHAALEKRKRKTMVTVAITPRTVRVLPRGNWLDDSGEVVTPAIPAFLGKLPSDSPNRLDLARWLTDAEQGVGLLTARVMANRFWYLCFGAGISRDLGDFGGQGEPPSHPELLDRLAHEFVESGWDTKHMMKTMVMSRTYRLSSQATPTLAERDPENRLFARQSRFRLVAEMIRDNALAVSGLLVRDYGGPSVKPYQPAGYYRHLNFPTRVYHHDTDSRQWRRGVYVHWQRQFLHPMLRAFDAPSREECTAQRTTSNTPLAALTLLNDPTFVEAAQALSQRILAGGGETEDARIDFAFQLCVSRSPDDVETKLIKELIASQPDEAAAWQMVARAMLNLQETNYRY